MGRTGERGQPKWVGVWKGTYLSKLQFGLGRASHAEERREGQDDKKEDAGQQHVGASWRSGPHSRRSARRSSSCRPPSSRSRPIGAPQTSPCACAWRPPCTLTSGATPFPWQQKCRPSAARTWRSSPSYRPWRRRAFPACRPLARATPWRGTRWGRRRPAVSSPVDPGDQATSPGTRRAGLRGGTQKPRTQTLRPTACGLAHRFLDLRPTGRCRAGCRQQHRGSPLRLLYPSQRRNECGFEGVRLECRGSWSRGRLESGPRPHDPSPSTSMQKTPVTKK